MNAIKEPLSECRRPGCRRFTRDGLCDQCRGHRRTYKPKPQNRGYNDRTWTRASKAFRSRPENLICALCKRRPSMCTDHIIPTFERPDLFYDPDNWQALCGKCNTLKGKGERGGTGRAGAWR